MATHLRWQRLATSAHSVRREGSKFRERPKYVRDAADVVLLGTHEARLQRDTTTEEVGPRVQGEVETTLQRSDFGQMLIVSSSAAQ